MTTPSLSMRVGDDFTLTLRWTCSTCGWTTVLDAPGFAGDGRWHYIDGQRQCGPITAQKEWEDTHRQPGEHPRAHLDRLYRADPHIEED